MDTTEFAQRVAVNLPYVPNGQQAMVVAALARFCAPAMPSDRVFLLNGYAGTGKTSLTGALVKALGEAGVPSVLLAPTGRAAKVFGAYAGHAAYTIHRKIYRHPGIGDSFSSVASMQDNRHKGAVFIVDEASMIGAADERGSNLLQDLIHYVYTGDNCRLILIGDTAQLPPVGCAVSPAMDPEGLRGYGLKVTRAVLTETQRQDACSGILFNATRLRQAMRMEQLPLPKLYTGFDDVSSVGGEELPEVLEAAYNMDGGIADTILITRSNRRASDFNRAIRANILYREEELAAGEMLLVAKNNYLWASKVKGLDFIANGDVMTVNRVYGSEFKYGIRFADVSMCLSDRPDIVFDAKIMLDTLAGENATLPYERQMELYRRCLTDTERFAADTPMETRLKSLRTDPYFNALQMKYAYAVTCHKAQGGQWSNVFVDMGYIPEEAMGMEFYRWLYTAVSRARRRLYFINPSSSLVGEG